MKKKFLALLISAAVSLSAIPYQALAYSTTVQKVTVVNTVNFRDQPSTSGARIRYLQPGEVLDIVSTPNDSWLQVKDSSGKVGYVSSSASYVKFTDVKVPAQPNGKIVSSVSFRTGPSTDDSRIRYLQAGELVLVMEQVNAYWYKVQDKNDVVGYVSTSDQYIDTDFGQAAEPEEPLFQSPPNATIVSSVSFRTGPSTDADRMRYLQKGEKVLVLNKTSANWYNVQDQNGVIGYVSTSSQYITTTFVEPYKLLDPAVAAQKVIDAGMKYLGVPYEFGSSRSDTSTFDCSDFVRQAYIDGIGQVLPGDSRSQGAYVTSVGKTTTDWHQLKKGDLLFFMSSKGYGASNYVGIDKSKETITHVGLYLGDGKMLHTYSTASGGVHVENIAGSQWELRFLYGGSTY
ncbi:NlpC/P60 family protein [Paenibacillus cremeus]|uniref:NlpC/P60 family protein n=2 Tax=Paenibacillus cremeus TaxID=2163881 RepID=A0A559K0B5_9BACL|nr:NlpC/P60 family protein [Paenibacillus cremeus]